MDRKYIKYCVEKSAAMLFSVESLHSDILYFTVFFLNLLILSLFGLKELDLAAHLTCTISFTLNFA